MRNPVSSSGTLSNAAMRVCSRNRPPSGASSMRVTGRANVPAHESNASRPASTSRSWAKKRCITHISASEFVTGVPVANVATLCP